MLCLEVQLIQTVQQLSGPVQGTKCSLWSPLWLNPTSLRFKHFSSLCYADQVQLELSPLHNGRTLTIKALVSPKLWADLWGSGEGLLSLLCVAKHSAKKRAFPFECCWTAVMSIMFAFLGLSCLNYCHPNVFMLVFRWRVANPPGLAWGLWESASISRHYWLPPWRF